MCAADLVKVHVPAANEDVVPHDDSAGITAATGWHFPNQGAVVQGDAVVVVVKAVEDTVDRESNPTIRVGGVGAPGRGCGRLTCGSASCRQWPGLHCEPGTRCGHIQTRLRAKPTAVQGPAQGGGVPELTTPWALNFQRIVPLPGRRSGGSSA
jgi:hypothetical protein